MKRKKQVCFFVLPLFILMCLCSCASRSAEKRLFAYLTDRAMFVLLPTAAIEKPMDMAQYISASFMGQNHYFNAWVRADETAMDMTLFNDLGGAMGDLSYTDGAVNLTSRVLPGSLQAEYIIADFQLCFYDPVPLRRALEDAGLSLNLKDNFRRIFDGETLIIEVEKTPEKVSLVNYLRGYAYTLEGDFE